MNWNAICQRLEDIVNEVPGINAFSVVPDNIPAIAFIVGELDIDLNVTMRKVRVGAERTGTDQGTLTCRILVARTNDKFAQIKLREFIAGSGPASILQALESDRTLGGLVDDSAVRSVRANRMFTVADSRYYGVEIDLFMIGDA